MKLITLQFQNIDREIMEEKEITMSGNDVLIMHFPNTIPISIVEKYNKILEDKLKTGGIVPILDEIKFSVIKSR